MAIICMCCYDTEENGRSEYTLKTLDSLRRTVDWGKHRLIIIDNNSCELTKMYLRDCLKPPTYGMLPTIITLSENVGTARAINMGISMRKSGESVVKIDNDVVIHQSGWVDEMEDVVRRDESIGIIGLKRKDLRQTPHDPDPNFRSELVQLSHVSGERWMIVEVTNDIMGTCTMLSSRLLDTIGGYFQGDGVVYSFDDTLLNLRAGLARFKKCFLPHIDIDHIDTGLNPYSQEKIQLANKAWKGYHELHKAYITGERPLFESYE